MVAWRFDISLLVLKNISLVRYAHSKRNFVPPRGHVIFSMFSLKPRKFRLIYELQLSAKHDFFIYSRPLITTIYFFFRMHCFSVKCLISQLNNLLLTGDTRSGVFLERNKKISFVLFFWGGIHCHFFAGTMKYRT